MNQQIQAAVKKALADADCAIAWGEGPDALNCSPLFMRSEDEVDKCEVGFFSVNNPALFLPEYKGKKVVVVAKGCDSRSIGELATEGLIKREDLHIIGFGCKGVIDQAKVTRLLYDGATPLGVIEPGAVESLEEDGDTIVLKAGGKEARLNKADITADKCSRCKYPNTLHADEFIGSEVPPVVTVDDYPDLAEIEAMSLEERFTFWEKAMERCTRCYACRNACPMCVCRDHCIATSREPQWVTQADGVRDKLFFQIIHAMHLVGRCTGCGECERACPVGIPVLLLKRSMSRSIEQLFGYEAGVTLDATLPLLSFEIEEHRIKERDW